MDGCSWMERHVARMIACVYTESWIILILDKQLQ